MTLSEYGARIEALEQQGDEEAGEELQSLSQEIRSCCWMDSARPAAYELAARADRTARALGFRPLPKRGSVGTTADGQRTFGGRY